MIKISSVVNKLGNTEIFLEAKSEKDTPMLDAITKILGRIPQSRFGYTGTMSCVIEVKPVPPDKPL